MTTARRTQKKFPLVPVIVGIVGVALIAVVILTFDSGGSTDEIGSPQITGAALPPLPEGGNDPAIGLTIPEVVGADFDGNTVSITNDGRAKIVLLVAHWCPFCQREVPIVKDWLENNPLPDGVDLYTVSTSVSSTRDNYPPSAWLEREGWSAPVILDNAASSVGSAFGLTAFPYWVFAAADGTVLARVTGGISPSDLSNAVIQLQTQGTG